jgi:predicted dinucleotide-binding enzyme
MKIGLLGSGNGAQALGAAFIAQGHEVKMGTRDVQKPAVQEWVQKHGAKASAGTFAQAAAYGELVLLVVHGSAVQEVLQLAGAANLAGKVVIDVTNPLDFSGGPPPKLSMGFSTSLGEKVQALVPAARVVKALNTVGLVLVNNPGFSEGKPDMFICGNDAEAKKTVSRLLDQFGWDTIDLGSIEQSRVLEPMALVWILYGFSANTWRHAFKLLRS